MRARTLDTNWIFANGLPRLAAGCAIASGILLISAFALAQEGRSKTAEEPGIFESIGRWFEEQAGKIGSSFKDAGATVSNFGHEAGIAAKTTVEGAKDAAGAVARIPAARIVTGHEKCRNAPNGAPDCRSAATAICKGRGFDAGKSMDMTTAEVCPPKVYLSGRNTGPDCQIETFVSRALCQ